MERQRRLKFTINNWNKLFLLEGRADWRRLLNKVVYSHSSELPKVKLDITIAQMIWCWWGFHSKQEVILETSWGPLSAKVLWLNGVFSIKNDENCLYFLPFLTYIVAEVVLGSMKTVTSDPTFICAAYFSTLCKHTSQKTSENTQFFQVTRTGIF